MFDVICIGAALVDMVAQVERHPLDDDEVFVSDLKLLSGGAAANTAYASAKLGLATAFIGKLGYNDAFGTKIVQDFHEVGVSTDFLKYSANYGTGSAYVALGNQGDRRIYAHSGAANYLSKDDIVKEELATTKVIFLSSLKNLEPFREAAKVGRELKKTVVLNPGMLIIEQGFQNIEALLKFIDIIVLSQNEYQNLFELEELTLEPTAIKDKAKILFSLGIKSVIVTLGSKGAFLLMPNRAELIPPSKVKRVIDTTGAGDAFSAGFLYGFIHNLNYNFNDMKKNITIGNYIAGQCIQELGARNGIPLENEIKMR